MHLKKDRVRPGLVRHPWVYPEAIAQIDGAYENGDAVVVKGPNGEFVGGGFINDKSRLMVRLVTFDKGIPVDDDLMRRRTREAIELRDRVLRLPDRADAYRVIHSEGDGLPGLIVDRYADHIVIQCTSLAVSNRLDPILDVLQAAYEPRGIYERGKAEGLRAREGLPAGRGTLRGEEPPERVEIHEGGLTYLVNMADGQKTGFFLDQRDNRALAATFAAGRSVLDVCSFTGGFALAAAKGGAERVRGFDASAKAIAIAAENATANGVAETVDFERAEMFDELKRLRDAGEEFGLVILDPPKFARNRSEVRRALTGLRELNALAMRVLAPGGILITCTCSHHIDDAPFEETLREAARRARRELAILERRGAGLDHPTSLHCPEGRYLRCWILRAT